MTDRKQPKKPAQKMQALSPEERRLQLLVGELLRSANRLAAAVKETKKGDMQVDALVDQYEIDSTIMEGIVNKLKDGSTA